MHGWVEKYLRLVETGKMTRDKAESRLRACGASLILGRDFCESMESYEARRPDVAAFFVDRKRVFGF